MRLVDAVSQIDFVEELEYLKDLEPSEVPTVNAIRVKTADEFNRLMALADDAGIRHAYMNREYFDGLVFLYRDCGLMRSSMDDDRPYYNHIPSEEIQ